MDVAVIISIVAIVVTLFIGCASSYFAKQQLAAMNTQAEASKVQADAAKVQADASMIQAEAATEALNQTAGWRAKDERRAEPQFRVNVTPVHEALIETRNGQIIPTGESFFHSVDVLVENISSRDATINHVGIDGMGITQLGEHELGIEFPHRLASGHQIEFSVSANEFFGLLGGRLPEESEFVVFVAKSFDYGSTVERWDSRPFTVRLPPFHRRVQDHEGGK